MKDIKFIYGDENGLVVESDLKEDSIFAEQYHQAHHLLECIEGNMRIDAPNMLAFCGDRGDGKTSCMMSVLKQIEQIKYEWEGNEIFKYSQIQMIDPAFFDVRHNIVELVIGSLYNEFRKYQKANPKKAQVYENHKKLLTEFQLAKKYVQYLSQEPAESFDEIDDLQMLASGISLKDSITRLITEYLKYVEAKYLVIPIDDLDLNMTQAYRMCEEIRKYLCTDRCIILISLNVEQLNKVIENAINKEANYPDDLDRRSMASKYVAKLIPVANRINMPKVYDLSESSLKVENRDGNSVFATEIIKEGIPRLIFNRTRYLFYNNKGSISRVIPNNLRNLRHLLGLLLDMKDYDYCPDNEPIEKTEERRQLNKRNFRDYFYNSWTRILADKHRELAGQLVSYSDTQGLNKYVVQQLIQFLPNTERTPLLNSIINPANYEYNVSVGDVLYMIDLLDRSIIQDDVKNLLFFIRSFYSIKLYECYDLMTASYETMSPNEIEDDKSIYRSDAWFKRTNAMQRIVNGSFFSYQPSHFLAPQGRGRFSQARDYKVINGTELVEVLIHLKDNLQAFKEGGCQDPTYKRKCWLAEYFALTITRSIEERDSAKYANLDRANHVPYYLTSFKKETGSYVYDVVSIFYNILNVKYCYSRFEEIFDLYSFCIEQPWTLLGQMMRRAIVKDIAEEKNIKTSQCWSTITEEEIKTHIDDNSKVAQRTEGIVEQAQKEKREKEITLEYKTWRLLSNSSLRNAEIILAQMENMESRRYSIRETSVHAAYIATFYEHLTRTEMATYQKNERDDENRKTNPYYIIFEFLQPIISCFSSSRERRFDELKDVGVYNEFINDFNKIYEYLPGQNVSDNEIWRLFPDFFEGFKTAKPATLLGRMKENEQYMFNALSSEQWKDVFSSSDSMNKVKVTEALKRYYEYFVSAAVYYRLDRAN